MPWVATRLIGFLSYFAIAGSVIYGLLLSTKILDAIAHRPVTFALHQDLAAIGLGLAGVHAVLLGLDSSVPFSLFEILVPFAAPYRPVWVGLGQLALYLVAIVYASFHARRRIGQRGWRTLHYLTFLSFAGATAHGILSGHRHGHGLGMVELRGRERGGRLPDRLPGRRRRGGPQGRRHRCAADDRPVVAARASRPRR